MLGCKNPCGGFDQFVKPHPGQGNALVLNVDHTESALQQFNQELFTGNRIVCGIMIRFAMLFESDVVLNRVFWNHNNKTH